jgi:hypothetical protein
MGRQKILVLKKIQENFFSRTLQKFWAFLEFVSCLGRLYGFKIFISAHNFGHNTLDKSRCSKILGILGNFSLPGNFWHLIKVEEIFHLCQNMLGTLEKLRCSKSFERLENFSSVE